MSQASDAGADAPDRELADRVAEAVLSVNGVVDLHGGLFGEIGTYLPGRRVAGVRIDPSGAADVHVVLRWGVDIPATVDVVRRAVATVLSGPVRVTVEDIDTGLAEDTRGRES